MFKICGKVALLLALISSDQNTSALGEDIKSDSTLIDQAKVNQTDYSNERHYTGKRECKYPGEKASLWTDKFDNKEACDDSVELNNKGVIAINHKNWDSAIKILGTVIQRKPDYELARINIATAYLYLGREEKLQGHYSEALENFHKASFWVTDKHTLFSKDVVARETNNLLRLMGKNPNIFEERKALGDSALSKYDYASAIVEFRSALAIREDEALMKKLKSYQKFVDANPRQLFND